jgi:hypothetical protein
VRRTRPASDLVALGALAGLTAIFWIHRIYVDAPSASGFFGSDLIRYFYPTGAYLHDELRSGRLPLWNPYQLAGEPIMATHATGVLYPPNLLLFGLLSPGRALEAHAISHMIAAGFFTWLFAGRLGLDPIGRLVAAAIYLLSNSTLMGIYMTPFLSTQAWLPAILWSLHRLLSEPSPRTGLALALAASLSFLGGHVQAFVYIVQLAAAYGLFGLACVTPAGRRLRVVAYGVASGVLALGFVAPQLLPTWELAQHSIRSLDGLPFRSASFGAVPLDGLLRGLAGLPPTKAYPDPQLNHWRVALPAAAVPLALCGLLARRQRRTWWFFAGAALLTALLMLGAHTPLFHLYYQLPLGNVFRGPSRMAFLYTFAFAILIGTGVHGIATALSRRRQTAWIPLAAATAALLLVVVDLYRRSELTYAHPVLFGTEPPAAAELAGYLARDPARSRVFIENHKALYNPGLLYKSGMMHRFFVVPDYEPIIPKVYERYFNAPRRQPWHGRLSVMPDGRHWPAETLATLLDLLSVRHYASVKPVGAEVRRELATFAGGRIRDLGSVEIFERERAVPRAYAVRCVASAPSDEAALERIRTPSFDPRREAVLAQAPGDEEAMRCADAGGEPDTAAIAAYSPHEVVIDVTCGAPCLLVVTDLHYPGWRAYVNEIPTPLRRANVLFRGVELDPGSHRVVHRYEPASFRIGMWACGLAAALAVASLGLGARRRSPGGA